MRIESPLAQQSLVDSSKIVEKKDLVSQGGSKKKVDREPQPQSFAPSPFGSSGVYSLSSLRAAVDYHAKFLTIAQNNLEAANHAATIPRAIIDRLSGV